MLSAVSWWLWARPLLTRNNFDCSFWFLVFNLIQKLFSNQSTITGFIYQARFDEILAKFGFKGLPDNRLEEALGNDDEDDDDVSDVSDNLVADTQTVTHLNNGVFVIKIKRKNKPVIRRKKMRRLSNLVQEDENFMKVLKMQHLNERITNPVFKSKYPARRTRNILTRLINRK